jgi:hypothetical protein
MATSWSAEKPQTEGWYWLEAKAGDRYGDIYFQADCRMPVRIYFRHWSGNLCVNLNGSEDDDPAIDNVSGRWAGPIVEPREP